MNLSFNEFLSLPTSKKFDVIFTSGDFLDTRTEEKTQVILYTVNRFFIELYYDSKLNKIINVAVYEGGDILSKYTETE